MLSNEEVIEIVASAESHSHAAQAVVESAVRGWKHKYPTSKVDDCAVVCLFLGLDSTTKINEDENIDEEESSSTTNAETGKDWSALEGVSRLNTLLTLPSFVDGEDDENREPAGEGKV